MAMVRSSIKSMWNLSCEGGTYLYTQAKMGASFMFETWRRGFISLLVLASLPFLAPIILVATMVGGIFLVPFLCGVTAFCALFRPAFLSNLVKWFRSPKSGLRSGPRSRELVMEDLDVHGDGNRKHGASLGISNFDRDDADLELLDIDSEYMIVPNEIGQIDTDQEIDFSISPLNALEVEIEGSELSSPGHSTAEEIFDEPNAFEAVPKKEEDMALIAVKSMQDAGVRTSRISASEGSTMGREVEPHPEQMFISDTIAGGVDDADTDKCATILLEDNQQGEDDEVVNDRKLNEPKFPAFEHVNIETTGDHQDLSALKQVEEPNRLDEGLAKAQSAYEKQAASEEPVFFVESKAVEGEEVEGHSADQVNAQRNEYEYLEESEGVKEIKEEPSEVEVVDKQVEQMEEGLPESRPVSEDLTAPVAHLEGSNVDNDNLNKNHSGARHPVLIAKEQRLKEPNFLKQGMTEAQSASEDFKAVGDPENLVESEVVEEKDDEDHTLNQLTPGKEQERFDEYKGEIKESGQTVSVSTQPFFSEGKFEHSKHVLPLKDANQQFDDSAAIEGESEPNYESAPDSFSPSENEQEQVDAIESNARKLTDDIAHGLEGDTELSLKGVVAEDVSVVHEKEVEVPVLKPASEKKIPGVEERAVATSALEPVAPVIEEKSLPVEEVAPMADVAPVEVAAPVEEAVVRKTSEPASQVIEEEVEAPARALDRTKEVRAPVAEDISIVEQEMTKEPDAYPAAPQVLIEDETPIEQEKGIDISSVISEPTLEEKGVSAVEEQDIPAPLLKSEVLIMKQHPLSVESEAVGLAFPSADVSVIAEAAPTEVVASAQDSDANDLYVESTPTVEERGAKSYAPMEDVIPERVEDVEAPVLAEKGAQVFVEEAAAPATATSEVSVPIVEPEVTKEVEGKLDDVSGGLEKEMDDFVLEPTSSVMEQNSLPVDSAPVEVGSSVVNVPAIAEAASTLVEESDAEIVGVPEALMREEKEKAAPVQEASLEVAPLVKESDAKEAEVPEAPVVKKVKASVEEAGTSESDSLVVEPDVAREAATESAAPEVIAEEEAQFVQEKEAGLPLFARESVSDESEVLAVEEKDAHISSLGSEIPTEEQHSLPVDSEPVELASSVADVPAIAEAALMEKSVPVEAEVKKVEFPEISVVDDKGVKAFMAALEEVKAEESPEVVVPAQEGAAPVAEASIVQPELTKEVKVKPAVSEAVEEDEDVELCPVISESATEEKELLVVAEPASALESEPVVEKFLLKKEAAPVEYAAPEGEGVVEEDEASEASVIDVKEIKAPVVALQETPTMENAASEAEAPIADVEGTKESRAGPAAPEVFVEEAEILQGKVELPLVVSEPTMEAPGVDEASISTDSVAGAPVVAEKSLPAEDSIQVQQLEPPVVEKEMDAHVAETFIEEEKVGEAPEAEAPVDEPEVTKDLAPAFTAAEEAPDERVVELPLERLETNWKPGRQVGHYKITSNLDPSLNAEDSMAGDENVNQALKDRSVKVLDMDLEDAPIVSSSFSIAQREEQENEADEDVLKLEENFEKDKAAESHTEQDVFPTLKPLNVIQSKDSSHHEQAENSDSISISAPAQRRISFEGVRADDDVNMGAPFSPSRGTGIQGTNFVFKSRLRRYHRTHRHSAPDFLAAHSWMCEAPLYSPQDSFRGHKKAKYQKSDFEGARPARTFSAPVSDIAEPHVGEFESFLQSWQEGDKATHFPLSASPRGSPRSPVVIGCQIREEISIIQKIIGQEIPPQYSLWKEVESLCQIVGMELPYMGDVSDLTKARHGLDLLKVVVGIKCT